MSSLEVSRPYPYRKHLLEEKYHVDMPSRRTLLQACGAVLGAGTAGCLSPRDESSPNTGGETDSSTTESQTDSPAVREVDSVGRSVPNALAVGSNEEPLLSLAVGSRINVSNPDDSKPHIAQVWNDTDGTLSVELELTADGVTLLDETYEFDADANLAIEFRQPSNYELTVRADDHEKLVEIHRGRFDCNDSATDVAIRGNEIEHSTVTTSMACSTTTA